MLIVRRVSFALLTLALLSGCGTSGPNPKQSDADRLNSAIGKVTRADVIQRWGPPNQTMNVDGDDFYVYTATVSNRTLDMADALSGFGAGVQGTQYTSAPRPQQRYILRFDGVTGILKGWSLR